ncbi:GNAT family N-acetyltransferase [Roseibium algae]|uniref:GNAT family N-acetyltransferase n=1 Tax=Roseibium algae TaxID=3123038 RepID=A0ABU8TFT1_9HYPH
MSTIDLSLNGYTDLPKGKLAYVVTYLEMLEKASLGSTSRNDIHLECWERPDRIAFKALFREIGEEWLWFSRLVISDEALDKKLNDPHCEIYCPMIDGKRVGLLELSFKDPQNVEVAYFGLVPSAIGSGKGRWLMANAVQIAWSRAETKRLWLHTCTGDSPQAIHFYQSCGYRAFKRAVEVVDDPRCSGHLPRTAGPHVPVIE